MYLALEIARGGQIQNRKIALRYYSKKYFVCV